MIKNDGVLVSVVTVCYNSEDTIEKAINSVLNQTYKNIEYIIIDGNSTDSTIDIIKGYSKNVSRIISEPDAGIYYAMNKGIEIATGEIITFLNSDDEFMIDTVKNAVECYVSSDADIIYGNFVASFRNGDRKEINYDSVVLSDFHYGFPIPHPGTFVKLALLKKYRFNTDYRIAADYELFFRMYLDGCSFEHYKYNAVLYSMEGVSSVRIDEVLKENLKIKLKYIKDGVNISKIYAQYFDHIFDRYRNVLDAIKKLLQDKSKIVIFGCGKEGKRCLSILRVLGIHPMAVIDNDINKAGSFIDGFRIEYPKNFIYSHVNNTYIIASTKYEKELKNELVLAGVMENNILLYGEIAEAGLKNYMK